MNRFEAIGLAVTAAMGQRVVVLLPRLDALPPALELVGREATRLYETSQIFRVRGHEAVKIYTGEVIFTFRKSDRTDHYDADFVFFIDAWTANQDMHDKAAAMVAVREGLVVTR